MRAPPASGPQADSSAPAIPRPASAVVLLRDGKRALELLLVRRNPHAHFAGGAWVFPGGAVNAQEGSGDRAHRAAALRELREEAGIDLGDPAALVPFAHWITPRQVHTRFDTWFYLAAAPPEAEPRIDRAEVVDCAWFAPREALTRAQRGELFLVFPTVKQLEQLAAFSSVAAALAHAASREVVAVEPQVLGSGEAARIVLPGEVGWEP